MIGERTRECRGCGEQYALRASGKGGQARLCPTCRPFRHHINYAIKKAALLAISPTRECVVCHAQFKATGRTHWRCQQCRDAGLTKLKCAECGVTHFSASTAKFCSEACRAIAFARRPRTGPRQQLSRRLRFETLARDNFTCTYCGRKAPDVALEVDHIKPLAQGGLNTRDNLTTACHDCNAGKRDRLMST